MTIAPHWMGSDLIHKQVIQFVNGVDARGTAGLLEFLLHNNIKPEHVIAALVKVDGFSQENAASSVLNYVNMNPVLDAWYRPEFADAKAELISVIAALETAVEKYSKSGATFNPHKVDNTIMVLKGWLSL